jgi:hypothetical protein
MGNTSSSSSDHILQETPDNTNSNSNSNTSNTIQTSSNMVETNTNNDDEHQNRTAATSAAAPMMMSATMSTTPAASIAASTSASSSIKKELIIESGSIKGFVEVGPDDTLADVRVLLHEEFDDDMLPTYTSSSSSMMKDADADAVITDAALDDFYFCVAGVRLSRKQERRKRAWDWVGQTVRILARATAATETTSSAIPQKRPREQDQEEEKKEQEHVQETHREAAAENTAENESKKQRTLKDTPPNETTNAADDAVVEAYKTPSTMDGASDMIMDTTTTTNVSAIPSLSLTKKAVNLDSNFKATETARDLAPAAAAEATATAIASKSNNDHQGTPATTVQAKDTPMSASANDETAFARRIEIEDYDSENDSVLNCQDMDDSLAVDQGNGESADSAQNNAAVDSALDGGVLDMVLDATTSLNSTGSKDNEAVNLDSNFKATETAGDPVPVAAAAADSPMAASTNDEIASVTRMETEDHFPDNDNVHDQEDDSLAVNQGNEETTNSAQKIAATSDAGRRKDSNTTTRRPRNNDADDDILVTGGTAAPAAAETETSDTHKIHEQALAKSCLVLKDINTLLQENPLFCSQDRRQEWSQEIQEILAKSAPKTIIGVLGNTGVGKSSLLNALLDEAAVLPTSGSRGCTAAVVELRFNSDLTKKEQPKQATATATVETVPVYKGEVEFMTLAEWGHELKILIDECSTHEEKTIYARPPDDQRQPDAAAAWGKYNTLEHSILRTKETPSHPEQS